MKNKKLRQGGRKSSNKHNLIHTIPNLYSGKECLKSKDLKRIVLFHEKNTVTISIPKMEVVSSLRC